MFAPECSPSRNALASQQVSRARAMRPAEPLSEQTVSCLAFLARVASVAITGGSKKQFEIRVELAPEPDAETTTTVNTASSFVITRTAEEIATLQRVVVDVCGQHPSLANYGIAPCALCQPFVGLTPLPAKTTDRAFHSEASIHKAFENRLQDFVAGAVVAPTNADLYCEGQEKMPVAVARFLLRGVDQTQL